MVDERLQAATFSLWMGFNQGSHVVDTSGFGDRPQSTLLRVAKSVPFRLRHHDGSSTLYFFDVAIDQNEVGLLAGKCDMAALLTDIQMSPTLTTCRVLHNTSPIVLVDSGGHLFAHLAEPTMEEPGDNFVFLRKKKSGAVFAKLKTASENSPAPITNRRVDVSVTNGGSPWDTTASLDVLPTDRKQFDKTSKQTMQRVRFANAVFCRPDQCSLTNSNVDDNSCLISE
jgi:hypothetical protein